MHYSQKRRYYFFIAIAKFKTILSYYPPLAQAFPPLLILRSTFAQPSLILRLSFAYPSLILRSTFAQPSLNLRSTFAQPSLMIAPHLRHTCATLAPHTLANFQSLPKLISCLAGASFSPLLLILRHILGCASSPTFLRHILGCASSPTFLRSTFAQPSLKVR